MKFIRFTNISKTVLLGCCIICGCAVSKVSGDGSAIPSESKDQSSIIDTEMSVETNGSDIQAIDNSDDIESHNLPPVDSVSKSVKQGLSDSLSLRDTLHHIADSTGLIQNDTSGFVALPLPSDSSNIDGISPEDTMVRSGAIEAPAFSAARDSVIEDFSAGRKMLYYYGNVSVTYEKMKITAGFMAYDVDNATVFARGIPDTAGVFTEQPVMNDGEKTYEMEECFYNFNTRKARVKNAKTDDSQGILRGEKIKMMPDKSINIKGGKFTVCDAEHPHYYLKMTTAKVETEPKQKTVFGPAYVVLADVPLPAILPFGFVPSRPDRASGILFPTFGEEQARGFYLQDGGLYFAIGDYVDVALTGSYYTLGSYSGKLTSRYNVRYKFNGNLNINFSNDQVGEKGTSEFSQTKNFGVQWSHSQDSKAHPGMSFRASVNFSSPSNSRYNERNVQSALTNQTSSSISWSRTWQKASLSVNALHSQNTRDSSYAITFPNVTFSLNRFYPFKKKERVGKEKWYEQFSLSYNTQLQNKVNFKASDFSSAQGFNLKEKLQSGMSHSFAIGLPSFTLLKYINFSPSVNYGMNWFFQSNNKYYNPETDKVEDIRTEQFGDFGLTQDFSASVSMSTRIYGTFVSKNGGSLKAVRHVITPSFSFSYKPEHGTEINGYRTYSYIDKNGQEKDVEYNKYSGGMNSVPSKGQTAALSFSFGNNLEAKVADKKDTTGVGTKKIKLIDQLSISGSYNFIADSMRLSTIPISMNTNVLQKVGIHGNITLDPYAIDEKGSRINQYNVVREGGFKLFRMTNASASVSFNISGDGKTMGDDGSSSASSSTSSSTKPGPGGSSTGGHSGHGGVNVGSDASPYMKVYYDPFTGEYIPGGWVYYMNTTAPWSLNFSYSLSYSKSYSYSNGLLNTNNNITQTLGVSGQVKLTRDFSINLNTGFDFTKMKLSTTQLSATYDLHCFQITFSYVPSGKWAQWNFRIAAKASALSDLLQYKKQSSYWDSNY